MTISSEYTGKEMALVVVAAAICIASCSGRPAVEQSPPVVARGSDAGTDGPADAAVELPVAQPTGPPAWRWENPRIPAVHLYGVWGTSADDVLAVGEGGTILHTRDGGATWMVERSNTDATLRAIWGSGPDDIFVVGAEGTILHSRDGGATWTAQPSAGRQDLVAIWGRARGDVFIVDGDGGLLHGGGDKPWVLKPTVQRRSMRFRGIWGSPRGDIWIVGNDDVAPDGCARPADCHPGFVSRGMTVRSRDGGKTWQHESRSAVTHAIGGHGSRVFIAASDEHEVTDAIHLVDAQGATHEASAPSFVFGISSHAADGVYAVGNAGMIVHSRDGRAWTPQLSGSTHNLRAVWGATKQRVYAVGDHGTILRTEDGATWHSLASITAADLRAVWSSHGEVVAVGDQGTIARRATDGTWRIEPSGTREDLVAIWASAKDDLYVVGMGGSILRQRGRGQPWKKSASGATSLRGVWGSGRDDVFAVGARGAIVHSVDGGQTWVARPSGVTSTLTDVWGGAPDDVYVVGAGNVLLHSADAGRTWRALPGPIAGAAWRMQLTTVWGRGDERYVLGSGGVSRSQGGGAWSTRSFDLGHQPVAIAGNRDRIVLLTVRQFPASHGPHRHGAALESRDGVQWTAIPRPGRASGAWQIGLHGVSVDEDEIVIVGDAGAIVRYGP